MALTLKGARASLGLTQDEVASLLNISTRTYIKRENDISLFTIKEVIVLIEALKLTKSEMNQIFFKEKEETWSQNC